MKKLFLAIICFTLFIVFYSCSSEKYTLSSEGDQVKIELLDGNDFSGEMICISDTAIIFVLPSNHEDLNPQLVYIPNKEIKSIKVQGYNKGGWETFVLFFQVIPAGLLAAAAAIEGFDALNVGLISAIPAAVTSIFFIATEGETPQWDNKMPLKKLKSLEIYARYPHKLNKDDLSSLMMQYDQKDIKKF